jgi:NAD-dependent SIR2 family protein deacetylase
VFSRKRPNEGHAALAALEREGAVLGPITQNVDRLHQRAGSESVIELHGALEEVRCLRCERIHPRHDVQVAFVERNPDFTRLSAELAPDGDAELPPELIDGLDLVGCAACGGVLKPHVVFFGESVPRPRVEAAFARVASADALLVLGTSLAVFSGFRFVRRAHELGLPIVVVNAGATRARPLATIEVEARLGDVLPRLRTALRDRAPVG